MKVRSFYTKIWNDKFFAELTSAEKLLFIYYVFNLRVNTIYCYECPDRITKFETNLKQSTVDKGKQKFKQAKKIGFFKDYIFIANGNRYQTFAGSPIKVAKSKLIKELPLDVKGWFNNVSDRGIDGGIDTPLRGSKTKTKTKINIKDKNFKKISYLENIPEEDIKKMLNDLNVNRKQIKSKANSMIDYCASKNKKYANYRAELRLWLRKDFGERDSVFEGEEWKKFEEKKRKNET